MRENVVIVDVTGQRPQVLGECDPFAAPTCVHQDAIYLHEGQQYHVVELDWEQKKAYVQQVDVDYYTDASLSFNVAVLLDEAGGDVAALTRAWGDVRLTFTPTIYKKIRFATAENVGWGTIDLPAQEMQTTAYWLTVAPGPRRPARQRRPAERPARALPPAGERRPALPDVRPPRSGRRAPGEEPAHRPADALPLRQLPRRRRLRRQALRESRGRARSRPPGPHRLRLRHRLPVLRRPAGRGGR